MQVNDKSMKGVAGLPLLPAVQCNFFNRKKPTMNPRLAYLPLAIVLLFSGAAHAHQIWLEQTPKAASLYFGEYDRNQREISPGLLDKITQQTATLANAQGEKVLRSSRANNAIVFSSHAAKGETIYTEDASYPVSEYKNGELTVRSARILGARLVTSSQSQEPKLTLDLVPNGKQGEFKIYYKGQAQTKTKVGLIAQSGWTREATSDEQGVVKFDLPWQGTYVLEVRYVDKTPGERDGKPYDFTNHMTTLSLAQSSGIKSLPTTPAGQPSK